MSQDASAPSGLTRRRRRLSDEETEQRMLEAALAMVHQAGLTVSLDHISFEDVIRDAGVARSAVYRRWPYKDLFFSDLLRELARGTGPASGAGDIAAADSVRRVLLDHLGWVRTPGHRRALAAEVLRQGALREFETFLGSPEWRTYLALHATFLSLPDGDLRTEVQDALTASEHALTQRVAGTYRHVAGLIGLRLRPGLDADFDTVASLASATIRGLVVMAPANPSIVTRRFQANPFGAPEPAEWSQPALGIAGIVMTFLDVDPAVDWTDERVEELRRTLTAADQTGF
ncbi:TetR/AcrR family transcriptional regulator [Actinomadura oligospora]|uniref:TetR/AcrR family transcriptional regulator n=1 Tax=Actinomadura oligospora TaxID=111804 RepID=UPI0004B76C9F|nr:TetR/AcrR family transcriptional regulator [Actinomadura oligospora]